MRNKPPFKIKIGDNIIENIFYHPNLINHILYIDEKTNCIVGFIIGIDGDSVLDQLTKEKVGVIIRD